MKKFKSRIRINGFTDPKCKRHNRVGPTKGYFCKNSWKGLNGSVKGGRLKVHKMEQVHKHVANTTQREDEFIETTLLFPLIF